jgi:SAM-dependent methyltransferase
MNLISDIYKLLDSLKAETWKRYEASPDELDAANEIAGSALLKILRTMPAPSQTVFLNKFAERFSFLGGSLYDWVNPQHRRDERFEEASRRELQKIRNGRSVHLELGTYTAWPAERVEQEIGYGLGDLIRLDLNPDFGPDVVANAAALPFADESIDCVASNSLFEHVAYPHDIVRECWRVLRPGGVFRVVAPFHFVEHGCPHDYLRYTGQFFETVLHHAGFVDVISDAFSPSGMYYTLHDMMKGTIPNRPPEIGSAAVISHISLLTILAALHVLDDYNINRGINFHHSTLALAVKPGEYAMPEAAPDRTTAFVDRYLDRLICPRTGLPVVRRGSELVALDESIAYPVIDGLPHLIAEFGFGSLYQVKPSSREQLAKWQEANRSSKEKARHGEAAERDATIERMPGEIASLIARPPSAALVGAPQPGTTIDQLFNKFRLVFKKKPIVLADRAREAGEWAVAAHYYRIALGRNPNRPEIWIQYGHVLKEADRLSPAEHAYRQVIAGAPTLAEPYRYLGDVLSAQRKRDEAVTAYLQAQSLDPTSPYALSGLRKLGWSEKDSVAVEGISD